MVDVEARNDDGCTPLFIAAQQGHLEAVRLLLEAGANPSLVRVDGKPPLSAARSHGHADTVALLLLHGAVGYVQSTF
jgi:ankyrin repeat protein